MSQPSLTLPPTDRKAVRRRRLLELLGAAAIAATFVFLVLTQPADIAGGPGSVSSLVALGGFLLGALLLIVGVLPTLPTSTVVLIPVALVLNIVLGQLMGTSGLPFYLDSIGTVLIAVLAGPAAGAATGALSSIVWSFFNPTVLPFAAGAALIGFLAGMAARYGLFRRFYLAPLPASSRASSPAWCPHRSPRSSSAAPQGRAPARSSAPSGPWATPCWPPSPSRP
jgi:energy-coupling factor transport system substrate-specific component